MHQDPVAVDHGKSEFVLTVPDRNGLTPDLAAGGEQAWWFGSGVDLDSSSYQCEFVDDKAQLRRQAQ